MAWWRKEPGHQKPCYWLCTINGFLSSHKEWFEIPVSFECWKIIEHTDFIIYVYWNQNVDGWNVIITRIYEETDLLDRPVVKSPQCQPLRHPSGIWKLVPASWAWSGSHGVTAGRSGEGSPGHGSMAFNNITSLCYWWALWDFLFFVQHS